jgi:iron complex transport system substrate-binding protein
MFLFGILLLPKVWPDSQPQRIISLGPSLTKGLYLLGVQDKLIANTIYCIEPEDARRKEKIGTVVKTNVDKVLALKPDLVLATSLLDPKEKEKLTSLGIRVVSFSTPKNFDAICGQFLELGLLVGKEDKARKIVEDAKDEVARLKEKVKKLPRPKVLIQVGARPLVVAPGNYFINDYIEFAGGINVAQETREGIYSREWVLKINPEIIIITTMGMAAEKEKSEWTKYKTLSAARFGRIYIMDTDKITSPTPVSFVKALADFARIFHPELD